VIRRLFWLTLGAILGVTGYRRVTALARSISPVARAGELSRFAADVREGMALYSERHPRPEDRTLESHRGRGRAHAQSRNWARSRSNDPKDGR